MGKKGAPVEPEAPKPPPPPPEEPEEVPEAVDTGSSILTGLGWEAFVMPTTRQRYFYSERRKLVRVQPPYFSVLALDEDKFRELTKEDIWKAFFARKMEFKELEDGALSEDLKDPDDVADWDLILESYHVLINPEARAEYEQRNLVPHAQQQLLGLRVYHEARCRDGVLAKAARTTTPAGDTPDVEVANAPPVKK